MVPEDPSWPCIFAGEFGTGEYYVAFSSPGELISKNFCYIFHKSGKPTKNKRQSNQKRRKTRKGVNAG